MKAALGITFAAMLVVASSFVIPGPSTVISGRRTRSATSQVSSLQMGRGDTRTTKGKRKRHSFGKSRPHKSHRSKVSGEDSAPYVAPVARTWKPISFDLLDDLPEEDAEASTFAEPTISVEESTGEAGGEGEDVDADTEEDAEPVLADEE